MARKKKTETVMEKIKRYGKKLNKPQGDPKEDPTPPPAKAEPPTRSKMNLNPPLEPVEPDGH